VKKKKGRRSGGIRILLWKVESSASGVLAQIRTGGKELEESLEEKGGRVAFSLCSVDKESTGNLPGRKGWGGGGGSVIVKGLLEYST